KQRIDAALRAAGLDTGALPKGRRTAVRDLERLEALRLSVALALIGEPRLLGVDDVDLKLSDAERTEAWALLRSVAASGTTVIAVCTDAPPRAVVVSTKGSANSEPDTAASPGKSESSGSEHDSTEHDGSAPDDRENDYRENDDKKGAADALAETGRA
ncbi:ABC transporter ATP-binding protein, partial [Streptomyces sp. T-3]|nr:ABC transporter ATP-binding protein [Streptomyces sp. T-3]